ncbi:MAG: sigma-70 family RNA polymerase sigma factor [Phycisphaerales bacterium]|jgi:RNA polymerase sigma-70 factor (ECF subfamily)
MVTAAARERQKSIVDAYIPRAKYDPQALGYLYDVFYDRIFSFCVHRLFDRHAAEDVTSEVFLTVAQKISRFQGETPEQFGNWLYSIAAKKTSAWLRKTSIRKKHLGKIALSSQLVSDECDKASETEQYALVYQAIMKLRPKYQTIITLRFFEGLGYHRIGKIMNITRVSAGVILHRALKKLKKYIQELGGEL